MSSRLPRHLSVPAGWVRLGSRGVGTSNGPGHVDAPPRSATEAERSERRTAVLLLAVILIPAAAATAFGLVWLWPGDVSDHVREETTQFAVEGVTYPTGTVSDVQEMSCGGQPGSAPGSEETCAALTVQLSEGPDAGRDVSVPIPGAVYRSGVEPGDEVVLIRVPTQGQPGYQFYDFERSLPLGVVAAAFAIVVIAVARFRGLAAIVGLGFAFLILGRFLLPGLLTGQSPLLYALVGSSAIMFVVLYAAHGFSARTTTALAGTLFGLALSALLGLVITGWAHLTGVGSEDDFVLAAGAPDLNLSAVVMTGVIIAGLGILNDVTITQASAVWELHAGLGRPRSKDMGVRQDGVVLLRPGSRLTPRLAPGGADRP
jgi:YibE/F-like protein